MAIENDEPLSMCQLTGAIHWVVSPRADILVYLDPGAFRRAISGAYRAPVPLDRLARHQADTGR